MKILKIWRDENRYDECGNVKMWTCENVKIQQISLATEFSFFGVNYYDKWGSV